MKKVTLILILFAIISACVLPTYSLYTTNMNAVANGTIQAQKLVEIENVITFIENCFDNEALNAMLNDGKHNNGNKWTNEEKYELYPLYYFIFVMKNNNSNYFFDSNGLNFGVNITEQMMQATPQCITSEKVSWKIGIFKHGNELTMTIYIANLNVDELQVNDVIPHVLKIEHIYLSKTDKKVISTEEVKVTCGTMTVATKTQPEQVYNPQTGKIDNVVPALEMNYLNVFTPIETCPHGYSGLYFD